MAVNREYRVRIGDRPYMVARWFKESTSKKARRRAERSADLFSRMGVVAVVEVTDDGESWEAI